MGSDAKPAATVTFGGGGAYAFGFNLGVVKGLSDAGIDLSSVPFVGTSGGSHSAVAIRAGLTFDDVAPAWQDYVDSSKFPFWVKAGPLAETLYGSVSVDNVAAVAVTMLLKRRLLWSDQYRPADMVAASSSPFPFARPHKIGPKRYLDGGMRSSFSADLAPPADVQLLIAPFSSRAQGFLGRMGARQAPKESAEWSKATGGRVIVVGPSDEICRFKVNGMRAIRDMGIGRQIHDLAVPLGGECAAQLRRDHPDVAARLEASSG